jgi:hypothetical protein
MTGLFDTLLDAAAGTAPAILQHPRHRFASAESASVPWGARVEEIEAPSDDGRHAGRKAGRDDRSDAGTPVGRATASAAAARRPDDDGGPNVDPGRTVGPGERRHGRRVDRIAAPPSDDQSPVAAAARSPATASPRWDGDAPRLPPEPPIESAAASRQAAPERPVLLPEYMSNPRFAAPAGGTEENRPAASGKESTATDRQDRPGAPQVVVTIGRIEVIAPATRIVAAPATRPTAVPRARPRQTLDDYLARRR